jgi:hypothetical protein
MKKTENYLKYVLFAIIPILFIMPYGKFRCTHKKFKDPLETSLFWGLDGWSATHFFWYMIVGYVYPETFIISTIIGICWELFEHYYGTERPGWLGGYGDCDNLATDKAGGNWWYGKWSDVGCNISGFLIGQYMKTNKIYLK